MKYELKHGDCLEVMRGMEPESVDSIVTDPPAGIAFMGKSWDKDKGGRETWIDWMRQVAEECKRVIRPGGYALVWAIPRTSHWTGMAWELAGWEPRDKIYHCFSTGFPKSLSISKAIDRMAGAEREVVGIDEDFKKRNPNNTGAHTIVSKSDGTALDGRKTLGKKNITAGNITAPATPDAKKWDGWGTALKPSIEEWWILRKPLSEKTVAENVLKHGTGGINIDGCRVGATDKAKFPAGVVSETERTFGGGDGLYANRPRPQDKNPSGRFPSHLVLSYDESKYELKSNITKEQKENALRWLYENA